MKKLNIAFFGTPSFSSLLLEKLLTDKSINQLIDIKFIVTQPDRPVGRKQILTPTPVKLIAQKYQIPVFENLKSQISKLKTKSQNSNLNKKISDLRCGFDICDLSFDIDLCLVFAFGEIIPKELLTLPKFGFINVHPSLLPKYRGPSPIAYPLINGDDVTGVTLIKMDEQIDHGPIIAQETLDILPDDRRPDLEIKLTDLAFKMIKRLFIEIEAKNAALKLMARVAANYRNKQAPTSLLHEREDAFEPKEQNHKLATYTKLLKKSDGFIPFSVLKKVLNNQPIASKDLPPIIKNLKLEIRNSPKIIYNYFRGLYLWPGLWTTIRVNPLSIRENPVYKRLKIIDIQYKDEKLTIRRVQLEGKKEVDFETFNRAYKVF